jgi:hypothetical protein
LSKAKTIHKDDHLDQVGNVIFVETGSRWNNISESICTDVVIKFVSITWHDSGRSLWLRFPHTLTLENLYYIC